jgi:predicted component of type VI protein secretion system
MIRFVAPLGLALLLLSGCQQGSSTSPDTAASTPAPADAVQVKLALPGMT